MAGEVEDALLRLVGSMLPPEVSTESVNEKLDLVRRLMESQIGEGSVADDIAGTLNRINEISGLSPQSHQKIRRNVEKLQRLNNNDGFTERVLEALLHATKEGKHHPRSEMRSQRGLNTLHGHMLSSFESEEEALLRECVYAMQGVDGERIKFLWNRDLHPVYRGKVYEGVRLSSDCLDLKLPPDQLTRSRMGSGSHDGLRICGEAGWLYSRVESYCKTSPRGSIERSFQEALTIELEHYQLFLAGIRQEMGSLRQLLTMIRQPLGRLQILALIVDGVVHCHGSELLSALYQHSQHGDVRHSECALRLLHEAARPWYRMLGDWSKHGKLNDPSNEFFISENTVDSSLIWRDGFQLERDRIPEGLGVNDFVQPVLSLGKGINYIRKSLLDGEWDLPENDSMDEFEAGVMNSSKWVPKLQALNQVVHSHIQESLHERFNLFPHLFALKQFLLLGQGDFFSSLMDGIYHEYHDEDVTNIYRHSFAGILDSALKSSNAKDFPDYVLERLDVTLRVSDDDYINDMFGPSAMSDSDDRTVWDIFGLEYHLPEALVAIVEPRAQTDYQSAFSLLFGLRRVEYLLDQTWRQAATLQHALQTSAQYNAIKVSTSKAYSQATVLLRQIAITRQAMTHFCGNMKSYLLFEVLEGEWKHLVQRIHAAKTLDDIACAHDQYIAGIMLKSMLKEATLRNHVSSIFAVCIEFSMYQHELFGNAQSAADRAAARRQEAEERVTQGEWGFHTESEISDEETFFGLSDSEHLLEADSVATIFNKKIISFLNILDDKLNGSSIEIKSPRSGTKLVDSEGSLDSLRCLTLQLGYNKYYTDK